jgi:tRNA-2-methylthio-N6-dimethylallyladenosine synthase
MAKIAYARRRVPGLALSTDIIVGFPGETTSEFESTLDLVREARFDQIYSFIYSPRSGTPAAVLDDDVSPSEKKDRLHALHAIQDRIQHEILEESIGRVEEVLVEERSASDPRLLVGRTATNKVVAFQGPGRWIGRFMNVRISEAMRNSLRGEACEGPPTLTSPGERDIYESRLPLKEVVARDDRDEDKRVDDRPRHADADRPLARSEERRRSSDLGGIV